MKEEKQWFAAKGGSWHLQHGELAVTACYMPLPEGGEKVDSLPEKVLDNWREEVCWACARVAGIHTG